MTGSTVRKPLSEEAVRFRKLLIDTLWDESRFGYIDQDRFIGSCPICGFAIGVTFAGRAPRAALHCHGGCTEDEIASRIRLVMGALA